MTVLKHKIAAHPIQQAIVDLVQGTGIDELTLREIGERIKLEKISPQIVKHHLGQLVKYGFLDIVGGKYKIGSLMNK